VKQPTNSLITPIEFLNSLPRLNFMFLLLENLVTIYRLKTRDVRFHVKWQIRNSIVSRIWQLSKMSILSSSIWHGAFGWGAGLGDAGGCLCLWHASPVSDVTHTHLWDPRHVTAFSEQYP
jgi:hypothetical protein